MDRRVGIQRIEEFKDLSEIRAVKDRKGAVADKQVGSHRRRSIHVAGDGEHGHAIVECDPRGDERTTLLPRLNHKHHV